jgi:peroxiredoxin
MAVKEGDQLPDASVFIAGPDGPQPAQMQDLIGGKTVALFAVPGAFTPTCHMEHAPGFVTQEQTMKSKGVDEIFCVSVNDPFVMANWAKSLGAEGKITFLSDHDAGFTKAIGMDMDASAVGLGTRSKRYAMVVKDGEVKSLHLEENPGVCDISSAEKVVEAL